MDDVIAHFQLTPTPPTTPHPTPYPPPTNSSLFTCIVLVLFNCFVKDFNFNSRNGAAPLHSPFRLRLSPPQCCGGGGGATPQFQRQQVRLRREEARRELQRVPRQMGVRRLLSPLQFRHVSLHRR